MEKEPAWKVPYPEGVVGRCGRTGTHAWREQNIAGTPSGVQSPQTNGGVRRADTGHRSRYGAGVSGVGKSRGQWRARIHDRDKLSQRHTANPLQRGNGSRPRGLEPGSVERGLLIQIAPQFRILVA